MANSVMIRRGERGNASTTEVPPLNPLLTYTEAFWNGTSLSKDLVMKRRKNEDGNSIAKDVLEEIKKGKKNANMEQVGRALVGIYSTNQVDKNVISGIFEKMEREEMAGLKSLIESKIEVTSKGYMAKELTFLWRLFEGLKFCRGTNFHQKEYYFEPSYMMFLVDRLSFLSCLWKQSDYLFCMKSVCVEWLLSEKPESHKKYAAMTYNKMLYTGLTSINHLLVDIIRSYSTDSTSEKRRDGLMMYATKGNIRQRKFPYWLFFSICMMNLNNQADFGTVLEVLMFNDDIAYYDLGSHNVLHRHNLELRKAFRMKASLPEKINQMSKCLSEIDNQLVIIELKQEIETKIEVPRDAILVSYSTWMDQDKVFKTLFPDDDDSEVVQRLKRKRQQSECSSSAKGGVKAKEKGAKAKGKEAEVQWKTITTDFPLYGKGKGKKKISPY